MSGRSNKVPISLPQAPAAAAAAGPGPDEVARAAAAAAAAADRGVIPRAVEMIFREKVRAVLHATHGRSGPACHSLASRTGTHARAPTPAVRSTSPSNGAVAHARLFLSRPLPSPSSISLPPSLLLTCTTPSLPPSPGPPVCLSRAVGRRLWRPRGGSTAYQEWWALLVAYQEWWACQGCLPRAVGRRLWRPRGGSTRSKSPSLRSTTRSVCVCLSVLFRYFDTHLHTHAHTHTRTTHTSESPFLRPTTRCGCVLLH